MGWILFTLLWVALSGAAVLYRMRIKTHESDQVLPPPTESGRFVMREVPRKPFLDGVTERKFILWGLLGAWTFWMLITFSASIHSVEKGHIGLITTFGAITNQRSNGLAIIAPWQHIEQVDVRSHTVCAKGDVPENGDCKSTFEPFSKENIDVHVHGTLTYHVDPEDIQFLYTTIGQNYENKVVLVMLADVVRVEFNKFGYQAIAANRAAIDEAIAQNMMGRIKAHPQPGVKAIKIDAFNTLNFDFNQDVKTAINQKVLETEKANQAEAAKRTAELTTADRRAHV